MRRAVCPLCTRIAAMTWGAHGVRPSRLRIRFTRVGESWLAADNLASTWR
jgi:hypothetical protein